MSDAPITPPRVGPQDRRPRRFPPPEFPPRQPKRFARTPPAIFPSILGLLGLGLGLRRAMGLAGQADGVAGGLVEAALGALLVIWAFAVLAYLAKIARRAGVLAEEFKVLPGRSGLAAATMSGMAAGTVLLPYAPRLALALVAVFLLAHLALVVLLLDTLRRMPPEARAVNPTMHLSFVGFIVGAVPLALAGQVEVARAILWLTLPFAALIWGTSLAQLIRTIPPAPLRPFLAIHLAPAALFATVSALTGQMVLAQSFAAFGAVIFVALLASARWLTAAGFTPLWGAFTFPLAAYAVALLTLGGVWVAPGFAVLALAAGVVPVLAWKVLSLWPGNRLAAKTNAAEA